MTVYRTNAAVRCRALIEYGIAIGHITPAERDRIFVSTFFEVVEDPWAPASPVPSWRLLWRRLFGFGCTSCRGTGVCASCGGGD